MTATVDSPDEFAPTQTIADQSGSMTAVMMVLVAILLLKGLAG